MQAHRTALAVLVAAGAVSLAAVAPAGATGPGGNGAPAICVPVPGSNHTTPAGGPGIGFVYGPPASGSAYDHVDCSPA
jgi:hypothetical protein